MYLSPDRAPDANRPGQRRRQAIGTMLMLVASGPLMALNNCLPENFLDRRGRDDVVIANDQPGSPFLYRPRCVTVSAGASVSFRAVPDFGSHPLFAGTVSGGVATPDPASPIGAITSGTQTAVVFPQAGEFPYYCDFHFSQGMLGSVRVTPEWFANGFE
jgi:plastocyanin